MTSYLLGRTQAVYIEESVSEQVPLSIEVPQGSLSRPLLFLAYILPLKDLIDYQSINMHIWHYIADDVQL